MSWDKNTYYVSEIPTIIGVLEQMSEPYILTKLGQVKGMGMNDDFDDKDYYDLYQLEYKDNIVLEQMQRTCDCDSDDILTSIHFNKGEQPDTWPLEIYTDTEGFIDIDDEGNEKEVETAENFVKIKLQEN